MSLSLLADWLCPGPAVPQTDLTPQPHLRASGHPTLLPTWWCLCLISGLSYTFHLEASWCLPCIQAHTSCKGREASPCQCERERPGAEALALTPVAGDLGWAGKARSGGPCPHPFSRWFWTASHMRCRRSWRPADTAFLCELSLFSRLTFLGLSFLLLKSLPRWIVCT